MITVILVLSVHVPGHVTNITYPKINNGLI